MRKSTWLLPMLCAMMVCVLGCPRPADQVPVGEIPVQTGSEVTSNGRLAQQYQFGAEAAFSVDLGDPPAFTPQVKSYDVRSGCDNVANRKLFGERLQPAHFAAMAERGFVVGAAEWKQTEFIYEQNNYPREHWPSFVTTDSILHTFHVFFDYCLRTIEVSTLYERAETLAKGLVAHAAERYETETIAEVKEAARNNFAYCVVPARLLEIPTEALGVTVPDDVEELVAQELALIDKHAGFAVSPTVGFKVDYSQFIPRGHYTRSDKLKRYFKAVMWYGLVPVALRNIKGVFAPVQARQAVLLADIVVNGKVGDEAIGKVWEDVYEPTAFMVGYADDNTPGDYGKVIPGLFGDPIEAKKLVPEEDLKKLAEQVLALRPPGIVMASVTNDPKLPGIPQFRVMGQRFVLDSHIFQMMVYPHVGKHARTRLLRTFPMGLDLFSVMGSERAYQIADKVYDQPGFAGYDKQTEELRQKVAALTEEEWTSNLYYGWLHTLRYLTEVKREGYPTFMQDQAWVDKQLNTALGSWAELCHDTILYRKQSVVAECGGEGGEQDPPPPPKGYVEPEVMTYWRLKLLATQLRDGLQQRGLLADERLTAKFADLISLLEFLEQTSVKELTGQTLTAEEYRQIEYYGDTLARLNLYMELGDEGDEITSATDKDMAVIADVHTGVIGTEYFALEEGVGHADEIYVVYPCEGKLLIGRGAVFSYHEFIQPVADRLTDEKWQEMLASPSPPKRPQWVDSFLSDTPLQGETGANVEDQAPAFTKGGC